MKLCRSLLGFALLAAACVADAAAGAPAYLACKDKAAISRAIDLTNEGDVRAAYEIFRRGIKSKDCQLIPAYELVIETTPPLSSVVKVHRRGNPDEYWMIGR